LHKSLHEIKCVRHHGMDCRDPKYKDVMSNIMKLNSDVPIALHGNWFPAVHAGMTIYPLRFT